MSATTVHVNGGVEARLDHMSRQLDELTAQLRRQGADRDAIADFTHDLGPVAREAMVGLTAQLQAAEDKGWFDFARGGARVAERVVTSFDQDDVEALGDNVVLILETVKEMTQPEIMTMLRRTAHLVNEPGAPTEPPSLLALLREMRDPQVRLGLARMLTLLRSIADTPATTTPPTT